MSDDNKQTAAILAAARMYSINRGQSVEGWVDEYERFLEELNRRDAEAGKKATAGYLDAMKQALKE